MGVNVHLHFLKETSASEGPHENLTSVVLFLRPSKLAPSPSPPEDGGLGHLQESLVSLGSPMYTWGLHDNEALVLFLLVSLSYYRASAKSLYRQKLPFPPLVHVVA